MGPIGRFVTVLNKKDTEHVGSASSADVVSCTNKDGPQRSHRAEKRRQDRGSHWATTITKIIYLSANQKSPSEESIETGNKKRLDPQRGKKKRGGGGAAVTREACWLERKPVLTPHAKYQELTDQMQQV